MEILSRKCRRRLKGPQLRINNSWYCNGTKITDWKSTEVPPDITKEQHSCLWYCFIARSLPSLTVAMKCKHMSGQYIRLAILMHVCNLSVWQTNFITRISDGVSESRFFSTRSRIKSWTRSSGSVLEDWLDIKGRRLSGCQQRLKSSPRAPEGLFRLRKYKLPFTNLRRRHELVWL